MRDALNAFILEDRTLAKDGPAKTWWNLEFDHPAIARALRIDPAESSAWYALAPFRYAKIDDRHLILAAHPAPKVFEDPDLNWLGIETIIAWEPTTNAVMVLGDDQPQIVGKVTDLDATIYADPRAFLTAWMRQRAWYFTARLQAMGRKFAAIPAESDLLPGALIIGDPERISWPIYTMPDRFTCIGIEPRAVNRAILKFAKLPICAGLETMKAAA